MDVNSLVSALVNSKVAGKTATLNARQQKNTTQLTAIGSVKSVLSLLQSSSASIRPRRRGSRAARCSAIRR